MDKYYLITSVPPPQVPPMLIKVSGDVYSKWVGSWSTEGDLMKYFMGDYNVDHISLQEAEEHMRGIAPGF